MTPRPTGGRRTWGSLVDNDAVERAIRNATEGSDRYNHELRRSQDWERMYHEMRDQMWRYRRQCWELRDRLYELKRAVREALDASVDRLTSYKEDHE